MPNYRRLRQPGATWFFTVNLLDRRSELLVDRVGELRCAINRVKRQRPFRMPTRPELGEKPTFRRAG